MELMGLTELMETVASGKQSNLPNLGSFFSSKYQVCLSVQGPERFILLQFAYKLKPLSDIKNIMENLGNCCYLSRCR